jgi:hypothetical protein
LREFRAPRQHDACAGFRFCRACDFEQKRMNRFRDVFLNLVSPRSRKLASIRPLTCSKAEPERQTPPGSAKPSSFATMPTLSPIVPSPSIGAVG